MNIKHARLFLPFIILLVLLSFTASQDPQKGNQQEKPIRTGITEKVDVNLVLLDAIVQDKKGNHIRGLKKEEFQVLEEGKEQKIAVFEETDLARKGSYAEALEKKNAETAQEAIAEKKPPMEHKGRTIIFLFDVYNNPSALFLSQAKKAVKDFMEKRFKPEDLAAVFEMTPELGMVTTFNSDPDAIVRSLDKIRFFPGSNVGDDLINEAANFRVSSETDMEHRLIYATALRNQISRQERQNFYYNLGSLAFTLSELPGRRMIIMFSGGFPMTVPGDINDSFGGITPAFKNLISDMAKSRVAIYTFDVADPSTLSDASQSIDYRIALDKLGFGEDFFENIGLGSSFWNNSAEARRQILAVLGNETGGSFMINPDYKAGLTKIDDDTNHYYVLGYYPSEKIEKDQYKKIKIKVARDGVTVIARKGRFAIKEEERKVPAGESALKDVKAMQEQIKKSSEAMIPCDVAAAFSPLGEGRSRVTFAIQVFDKIEPFIDEKGNGIVDMTLKIFANAGQITVDSKEKNIKAILKPEGVNALAQGFRLLEYMDVVPAIYDFQIVLRLNGMGKQALWSRTFEVKKFSEANLDLSTFSLALLQAPPSLFNSFTDKSEGDQGSTLAGKDPFEMKNGARVIPVATRSFQRSESIFIYCKLVNVRKDEATGKPNLDMTFTLASQEGKEGVKSEANVQPSLIYFGPDTEGKGFDALVELKVPECKPGYYLLKASITDKKAQATVLKEEKIQLL